ncbi:MAG: type I secretion system permease/ATPase [Pseudobdellovibrionaceae bacterium]
MAKSAEQNSSSKTKRTDTLLGALVFLTSRFGHARSKEAVIGGLAYDERGMSPALFCEAAAKLKIKAKLDKGRTLDQIPDALLPVVILTRDLKAIVLLEKEDHDVRFYDPDEEKEKTENAADFAKRMSGTLILVSPETAFIDPASANHEGDDGEKLAWFWQTFRDNKDIYVQMGISALLINIFAIVTPIFMMIVYNRILPNNALETGWVLVIGVLCVLVFDFIMRMLRGYFIDFAGRRTDMIVSSRIYDRLLNMRLSEKPASSGAFANMLKDFDSVRDFMTSATLTGVIDVPFSVIFLVLVAWIGGPIAFLLVFIMAVVVALGAILQKPLKKAVRASMASAERKHGILVETIQGLETLKATGAEGRFRAKYFQNVGDNARYGQDSRFYSGLGVNIAAFFQQAASILVILAGFYMVAAQNLTIGGLIACVMLGGRAIAPIGQVANLMSRYHQAKSSLKTLDRFMHKAVEREEGQTFLHRETLDGKIKFQSVSFSYSNTDKKALDEVSFTIQPGEKVGIIGRIGSGKSTIARLILNLYQPDFGQISADSTDYRQIDPADLRRHIAYIAQDVMLFSGTIRENLALSNPQASDTDILEAAKKAGVDEFVSRHPQGYDAQVGEGGLGLSGGQRQAMALGRALLQKPAIYVCDEPTNAMDMQSEAAFLRHMKDEAKDKTLILITHRHALLELVDRLIVVEQGKIVMDDSRDKVLKALGAGGAA